MKEVTRMVLGALGAALLGLWLALEHATTLLDRYVCPPPDGPNLCPLLGTVAAVVVTPIGFAAIATLIASLWST